MASSEFHPIKKGILKNVSDKRVEKRLSCMGAVADELIKVIVIPPPSQVFLNVALLTSAIRNYFIDVERYKDFHAIKRVERYKVASYSAKWILKCKPIQFRIDESDDMKHPALLVLNEMFALKWGLAACDIKEEAMKDDLLDEVLYTFQYRQVAEDNLTLIFKILGGSDRLESG